MNLSADIIAGLRSPRTHEQLTEADDVLISASDPEERYPIVEGIPVLIADEKSLFSVDQFLAGAATTVPEVGRWTRLTKQWLPSINANVKAKENFGHLVDLLPTPARVLVIGGRTRGAGSDVLYEAPGIDIVSTDVAFGPETDLICDAHDLPFQDEGFDAVIAQAVLEHVADPYRCVAEMHRVLKPDGLVHAETPFLQSMHMQPYDFTRFTLVGYRKLFARFDLVGIGPTCGPGMALAWSYRGFLKSMARTGAAQKMMLALVHLTAFPLKYLDYWLIDRPAARASAFGYFFTGRKRSDAIPDTQIIDWFTSLESQQ